MRYGDETKLLEQAGLSDEDIADADKQKDLIFELFRHEHSNRVHLAQRIGPWSQGIPIFDTTICSVPMDLPTFELEYGTLDKVTCLSCRDQICRYLPSLKSITPTSWVKEES